jgi:hypothetical protein
MVRRMHRETETAGLPKSLVLVFAALAAAVVGVFLFLQAPSWWLFAAGAAVGAGWFSFQHFKRTR